MSLDVYLEVAEPVKRESSGIFIRDNGATREISRAEWDERCPGSEPTVVDQCAETNEVYARNITHNLGRMASAAGIYKHLWRPDELGITKAHELIEPLDIGLTLLRDKPEEFRKHDPENGWGDYDGLVAFVESYLAACREFPDAAVHVSR